MKKVKSTSGESYKVCVIFKKPNGTYIGLRKGSGANEFEVCLKRGYQLKYQDTEVIPTLDMHITSNFFWITIPKEEAERVLQEDNKTSLYSFNKEDDLTI